MESTNDALSHDCLTYMQHVLTDDWFSWYPPLTHSIIHTWPHLPEIWKECLVMDDVIRDQTCKLGGHAMRTKRDNFFFEHMDLSIAPTAKDLCIAIRARLRLLIKFGSICRTWHDAGIWRAVYRLLNDLTRHEMGRLLGHTLPCYPPIPPALLPLDYARTLCTYAWRTQRAWSKELPFDIRSALRSGYVKTMDAFQAHCIATGRAILRAF